MVSVGEKLGGALLQAALDREAELDAQLQKLEEHQDEDDLEAVRRKRMDAMKAKHKRNQELRAKGHGEYSEIFGEKEFFNTAKNSQLCVCHFYRDATWRCKVIDKHLDVLAKKHIKTRFVKLNIEKSPYLAEKLRILCLPTVSFIKDGKILYSMIGFDDVWSGMEEDDCDDFHTDDLESFLMKWTVIEDDGC